MQKPKRIWWARPRKLCALERPGGGGRTHRARRRQDEIAYLKSCRVRLVVSTTRTRHNLAEYERAGLEWRHLPVPSTALGADALEDLLRLLGAELERSGAVAVHGDLQTDFVAALCAAHVHDWRGVHPAISLAKARAAGLAVTAEACALLGVAMEEVEREMRLN